MAQIFGAPVKRFLAAAICLLLVTFFKTTQSFSADLSQSEALYRLIQLQDVAALKELLSQGADPNDFYGDRPMLSWAAQNNNAEIVRALIAAKADVDKIDLGFRETPLLRAIENQHVENVQVLIEAKANPNAKDAAGEPAIARAVKGESSEIVRLLIDAGADLSYFSPDGDSLALMAAQANQPASVEVIKLLAKAKANLDRPNLVQTPLYYAVMIENLGMVAALLEGGANPNGRVDGGRTPLYAGVKNLEIVRLLLAAKADPNLQVDGSSPIIIAAIENANLEIVKALIESGANVNATDDRGNSALRVANNYSLADMAELLKQHGAVE